MCPDFPICGLAGKTRPCRPRKIGNYLRDLRKLFYKYGYNPSLYGHFGQGCIHCRIDFDLYTAEGYDNGGRFSTKRPTWSCEHGGSLSGEHGDGQARGEFLPKNVRPGVGRGVPRIQSDLGSAGKMNPGKVIDASRSPATCESAPTTTRRNQQTHFQYPDDKGQFARAALRCVGVGKCRNRGRSNHVPQLHGHA